MERAGFLQTLCVMALVWLDFDGIGWFVGCERQTLSQVGK